MTRPGTVVARLVRHDNPNDVIAEVYRSGRLRTGWRYRILGGNREIMAASEGYTTQRDARIGVHALAHRFDQPNDVKWVAV